MVAVAGPEQRAHEADEVGSAQLGPDDEARLDEDSAVPETRSRRRERIRHGVVLLVAGGMFVTAFVYAAPALGALVTTAVDVSTRNDAAACPPLVQVAPAPATLKVNVYNAGDEAGLAKSVAGQLKRRGFVVRAVGNDPAVAVVNGPAEIRHGSAALDAALVLSWQVKGAKLVRDYRAGRTLDFVIGADFRELVAVPPPPPPLPSEFKLNVYNTTFRTGLAGDVAEQLGARGFRVGKTANDPLKSMILGVGVLRHGEDGLAAAKVVSEHLPGLTLVRDDRQGSSVDLVLGNAYEALVPLASVPPRPTPTPTPTPTVSLPRDC